MCGPYVAHIVVDISNEIPGEYPVLYDKSNQVKMTTDFDKFVDMLRKSGQEVVIDAELTPSERSQIDAFNCFLQEYINPAVMHTFWGDDLNYNTVTHYWFSSRLSFPYNLYYLEKRRKRIQRLLSEKSVSTIMKDGLQALNLLSSKLGDNKFFCGNKWWSKMTSKQFLNDSDDVIAEYVHLGLTQVCVVKTRRENRRFNY
ncbi:hypothetical protein TELCIR_15097 [Teladorsagia circumcincta]|uniref:Mitochondrial outer membrane transport complex Sam37/metaxin N-terminal domain-containing protein n=1 Tax=Teladorsagia circumcincta TaxID=45464 RepID=A0A2G9TZ85_TELCI|nr:hypothetical protein TELCIR_15097 [Teladorsagia circumcincta]